MATWNIFWYLSLGISVGVVSGALGIGGGVLLVPALFYLFQQLEDMDHLTAARASRGTALGALSLPVLLPAAWQYFSRGWVNLPAAIVVAVGLVVGSYVGGKLGTVAWVPKEALRIGFGLLLVYLGVRYVLSTDHEVRDFVTALAAVAAALVLFCVLKLVGRSYHRTTIKRELQKAKDDPPLDEPDYYI
ncbi:MAG: sulfite exporter TauE/SafE family protein [Gemmataceae bacterium]